MQRKLGKEDILGVGMTSQRRRDQLIDRLQTHEQYHSAVLQIMRNMPRHLFIDEALANRAYEDCALPIGYGQTISQPAIVARMTSAILQPEQSTLGKVLEIGTGCGYQTAILAMLAAQVYSVERIAELQQRAQQLLVKLQFDNIQLNYSDGGWGWSEHAPYDAIIVTAAAAKIPEALLTQMAIGGRMVIPVGAQHTRPQNLQLIERTAEGWEQQTLATVAFVPLLSGCR